MANFRFIHCSDLHIDSPFVGLSGLPDKWVERLRSCTIRAFTKIVDLAIEENVDAVIIAGDVFDGAEKNLQAQLKFKNELSRLSGKSIPVYMAHGNHDALNTWSGKLEWPTGVFRFGPEVESFTVKKDGRTIAHLYGISYPQREVNENLIPLFKKKNARGFSIGVLHANVGGNSDHESYAPCTLKDLIGIKMDYWALGHVHSHGILRKSSPAIVYPGNSQGRHMRESGAKGCCLVTLAAKSTPEVNFISTDVIRFEIEKVDLANCSAWNQVLNTIKQVCEDTLNRTDGRDVVLRIILTGRTELHSSLQKVSNLHALQEDVNRSFEDHIPSLWVDLVVETRGIYELENLSQGNDFVADILKLYEEVGKKSSLKPLKEPLENLFQSWQGHYLLDEMDDEDALKEWLLEARDMTLDHLLENDS